MQRTCAGRYSRSYVIAMPWLAERVTVLVNPSLLAVGKRIERLPGIHVLGDECAS
jgi:hypothetical protein